MPGLQGHANAFRAPGLLRIFTRRQFLFLSEIASCDPQWNRLGNMVLINSHNISLFVFFCRYIELFPDLTPVSTGPYRLQYGYGKSLCKTIDFEQNKIVN